MKKHNVVTYKQRVCLNRCFLKFLLNHNIFINTFEEYNNLEKAKKICVTFIQLNSKFLTGRNLTEYRIFIAMQFYTWIFNYKKAS